MFRVVGGLGSQDLVGSEFCSQNSKIVFLFLFVFDFRFSKGGQSEFGLGQG